MADYPFQSQARYFRNKDTGQYFILEGDEPLREISERAYQLRDESSLQTIGRGLRDYGQTFMQNMNMVPPFAQPNIEQDRADFAASAEGNPLAAQVPGLVGDMVPYPGTIGRRAATGFAHGYGTAPPGADVVDRTQRGLEYMGAEVIPEGIYDFGKRIYNVMRGVKAHNQRMGRQDLSRSERLENERGYDLLPSMREQSGIMRGQETGFASSEYGTTKLPDAMENLKIQQNRRAMEALGLPESTVNRFEKLSEDVLEEARLGIDADRNAVKASIPPITISGADASVFRRWIERNQDMKIMWEDDYGFVVPDTGDIVLPSKQVVDIRDDISAATAADGAKGKRAVKMLERVDKYVAEQAGDDVVTAWDGVRQRERFLNKLKSGKSLSGGDINPTSLDSKLKSWEPRTFDDGRRNMTPEIEAFREDVRTFADPDLKPPEFPGEGSQTGFKNKESVKRWVSPWNWADAAGSSIYMNTGGYLPYPGAFRDPTGILTRSGVGHSLGGVLGRGLLAPSSEVPRTGTRVPDDLELLK